MTHAYNKADRLRQVENLLMANADGLTQSEIAQRLGVNRSTINRYLPDLDESVYVDDDGHWKIDRSADLIALRLNLHEALAVHLAARLLATRMDRQNPHAASALRKLGLAMERWAEQISRHLLYSADALDEAAQRQDPAYLQSLERLTLAWAGMHRARVWHLSERTGKVTEYLFCPYFIEPYAAGQTTMLIGYADPPGAMRTLKIERIEKVENTDQEYTIPTDFDPRQLLSDAWGIWYSENEPVEVTLRFSPRVVRRVQETRWHRSEQVSLQPDGSLIWQAKVAEPKEMLYWIRGWGSDCEVLSPNTLRLLCKEEADRVRSLYSKVE